MCGKNDPVRELLVEFYSTPNSKLTVAKAGRNRIWEYFKKNRTLLRTEPGAKIVSSIASEIDDAIKANRALQRSVFSECVYTFELANKLGLTSYSKYSDQVLPLAVQKTLNTLELSPRYVYSNAQNTRFLVQAGGPNSYDAVLINLDKDANVKIEYKEPASKAKELDVNYDESGYLVKTEKFTIKFRQLLPMLNEAIKAKVNIFQLADSSTKNFISFSTPSILKALDDNYTGENTADVICTEDKNGYLVLMSSNDVTKFVDPPTLKGIAGIKGEIRSAGRNKYKVWSHDKLQEHIAKAGGKVNSDHKVTIETAKLKETKGSGTTIANRLKISSIFFVYVEDVVTSGGYTTFDLNAVKQIKATISAHMYFRKLQVDVVRDYYLT